MARQGLVTPLGVDRLPLLDGQPPQPLPTHAVGPWRGPVAPVQLGPISRLRRRRACPADAAALRHSRRRMNQTWALRERLQAALWRVRASARRVLRVPLVLLRPAR